MSPENGTVCAPANYLAGDPAEPDSVLGGQLDCEPNGLRFHSSGGRELLLGIDSLLGISISGRTAAREGGRNAIRGTMRVAGLSDGRPAEWVFAVDRSAAADFQRQLNHELAARGKPALPHVEELMGFGPIRVSRVPKEVADPPPIDRVAAELGHRLDAADPAPSGRRRLWLWIGLATIAVGLEVAIPLLLVH